MRETLKSEEAADVPVRWKLRDINFTLHEFVPPESPVTPAEAAQQVPRPPSAPG